MFLTQQAVRFCGGFQLPPPKLFVRYRPPGKRKWLDPDHSDVEDLSSHRSPKDFILYETLTDPPDFRIKAASSGFKYVHLHFVSNPWHSSSIKRHTWPTIYNYISDYPKLIFGIWGSCRQRYLSVFAVAYFITKWRNSSNVPSLQNKPILTLAPRIRIKSAKEPDSCVGRPKDKKLEVLYFPKLSLCLFRIKALAGETCNNLRGNERFLLGPCRFIPPDPSPGRSLPRTEGVRPVFSVSYSKSRTQNIMYLIRRRCGRLKPRHFKSFLYDLRSCIRIPCPTAYRKKVRTIYRSVISNIFPWDDHPSTFTTHYFQQHLTHQPGYS